MHNFSCPQFNFSPQTHFKKITLGVHLIALETTEQIPLHVFLTQRPPVHSV